MEEVFSISVSKDTRISMVKTAREEIDRALSKIEPLFDEDKDIIKLRNCLPESDHIRLTYEILRDARRSKAEENRSRRGDPDVGVPFHAVSEHHLDEDDQDGVDGK